jgi:hypothetical protein
MDKKEQRRLEKELDDVSSSLSKAEYERQIGDYDKAKESITKAGQQYYELGIKKAKIVADYKIKTMESAEKLEIARLKAEKAGNRASDLQVIDQLFHTLVEEGKPADAKTYHYAMEEFYTRYKPQGSLIASGPAGLQAGAHGEDVITKRNKEISDEEGKYETKLFNATNLNPKNRALISEAKEKDAKAKRSITHPDSEEAKILDNISTQVRNTFPLLRSAPAAPAAAPAAAPKKDDKKKDGWGDVKVKTN